LAGNGSQNSPGRLCLRTGCIHADALPPDEFAQVCAEESRETDVDGWCRQLMSAIRNAQPGGAVTGARSQWNGTLMTAVRKNALQGDAEHFFQGGFAEEDLGETILEHGLHAPGDRRSPNGGVVLPLHDHAAEVIVDLEQFEHPQPSAEAAAMALRAASAAKEPDAGKRIAPLAQHSLRLQDVDGPVEVGACV
jgi:hypothetical protein